MIGRWVWTSDEIARSVAFLYFPPSLPTCFVYGVFGAWRRLVTILAIIRTSLLAKSHQVNLSQPEQNKATIDVSFFVLTKKKKANLQLLFS